VCLAIHPRSDWPFQHVYNTVLAALKGHKQFQSVGWTTWAEQCVLFPLQTPGTASHPTLFYRILFWVWCGRWVCTEDNTTPWCERAPPNVNVISRFNVSIWKNLLLSPEAHARHQSARAPQNYRIYELLQTEATVYREDWAAQHLLLSRDHTDAKVQSQNMLSLIVPTC